MNDICCWSLGIAILNEVSCAPKKIRLVVILSSDCREVADCPELFTGRPALAGCPAARCPQPLHCPHALAVWSDSQTSYLARAAEALQQPSFPCLPSTVKQKDNVTTFIALS